MLDIGREIGQIRAIREKGSNFLAVALQKIQLHANQAPAASSSVLASISRQSAYSTSSASVLATGDSAANVTAPSTGRLRISGFCFVQSSLAGDGGYVYLYRTASKTIPGAGNAPSQGDVVVGGYPIAGGPIASSGENQVFSVSLFDTGLTSGSAYSYYLAAEILGGGTFTIASALIQISED